MPEQELEIPGYPSRSWHQHVAVVAVFDTRWKVAAPGKGNGWVAALKCCVCTRTCFWGVITDKQLLKYEKKGVKWNCTARTLSLWWKEMSLWLSWTWKHVCELLKWICLMAHVWNGLLKINQEFWSVVFLFFRFSKHLKVSSELVQVLLFLG